MGQLAIGTSGLGALSGDGKMTLNLNGSTESDTRYRGLLEAAPDAIVVVNQDGGIVLLNLQAEKQFGYQRDELLGQKITRIIPEGFAERLIADGTRTPNEALAQQIGMGVELSGRRKDGSRFPIEIMLSPLESAEGILVTAAIRNITTRKDSEARYRGLLEAAPDAMVVVNQDGEIVLVNAQVEKQFGYRRDELIGQRFKKIIPEGFAERLIADASRSTAEALAQHIGEGIELSGRRKDRTEFPIEIMLSPLESVEGILVTAAIRNISARKSAEAHLAKAEGKRHFVENSLRESEDRYRMLLDGIKDYAIFMMDPRGQILSWNAGAELMKGYRADEIIGQNFSCFFPTEDIERGRPEAMLRLTSAAGRHEEQGMRVRKDGSRFLSSLTFTALYDQAGNLRGFSEFSHDLTESKESAAKYRGLLEAAPDAMVVVNQAGVIVLVNLQAEKQFGYRRDELVGQKVMNIIPEGFAERLIADATRSTAEALAQHIGEGIELSGRRKDGTEFPIEIMLSPLESAEGILVTAAIRNISARKKSEQELAVANQVLEESNLELKQFAYIASHDLQTPLRSITGFVQLLQQEYEGKLDEQAQDWILRTVGAVARMQTLIGDLLSYSRVEARSGAFTQIPFLDIVNDALFLLESSIHDSGGQVACGKLPIVMGDRSQLVQLMQNLIGNGLAYRSDKPPHIHISAKRSGKDWIFSISDNGIGIDPKHYEQIFEIFKRLHNQKDKPGTGIGLAVCRRVVNRHGGKIWVESEPGHGSTFHFTIPEGTEQTNEQSIR
jgi:PAS domain S-box-containing protein